MEAQIEGAL